MAANDYIVVHFLNDQPVRAQFAKKRNAWPLHVTLLSWFSVTDAQELIDVLEMSCRYSSPLKLQVGEMVDFDTRTRVNVIADQYEIRLLHAALLGTINSLGISLNDMQWSGENYTAHITHHDTAFLPQQGDEIDLNMCSLVKLLPGNICRVVQHFTLGTAA